MEENQMSEIFQRLKQAEITDAKQDTEIAVIKKMIERDIRYIKESLERWLAAYARRGFRRNEGSAATEAVYTYEVKLI